MANFRKPLKTYINELVALTTMPYGRNHVERLYGEELAEDIKPIVAGNYSTIKQLDEKYKYLEWYHSTAQDEFRKMPLALKCLKEETSSFMCDKMMYFNQVYYNINCVRELCQKKLLNLL